jgi:hypothetical protein
MGRRLEKLIDWFDLRAELEDHDFIHETITQGIVFRGTNLWILMFAIMVCSVGLNMNSTAVIIGAMLISPLMGPINGMGYGLATYDFPLFERSLKNLAFALGVSLLTSAFYFILSPLNEAHSDSYFQAHLMFETPFLILKNVPPISHGILTERLYLGQLYTPQIISYTELGYGIGNRLFNAAVFGSFHKYNFHEVGIRMLLTF